MIETQNSPPASLYTVNTNTVAIAANPRIVIEAFLTVYKTAFVFSFFLVSGSKTLDKSWFFL